MNESNVVEISSQFQLSFDRVSRRTEDCQGQQRAGNDVFALPTLALFGPHAMSDLSPECAPKRPSIDHAEFRVHTLVLASCVPCSGMRRRARFADLTPLPRRGLRSADLFGPPPYSLCLTAANTCRIAQSHLIAGDLDHALSGGCGLICERATLELDREALLGFVDGIGAEVR